MVDIVRVILIGAAAGAVFAGSLAAPNVFAQATTEPLKSAGRSAEDLFPPPFDPSKLVKYNIALDDSVSTDVQKTQTVTKIAFGKKKIVSIVTTPSGVYSSDAIVSPNVRYPGIEVTKRHWHDWWNADRDVVPVRITIGSITYLGYVAAAGRPCPTSAEIAAGPTGRRPARLQPPAAELALDAGAAPLAGLAPEALTATQ